MGWGGGGPPVGLAGQPPAALMDRPMMSPAQQEHQPVLGGQAGGDQIQPHPAVQRPGRDLPARLQLMQMPAQPLLDAGPLGHQVFPVIAQQPHLAVNTIQAGHGQPRLPQGRPGHRQGIDRVRLARGPRPPPTPAMSLAAPAPAVPRPPTGPAPACATGAGSPRPPRSAAATASPAQRPQMTLRGGLDRHLPHPPSLDIGGHDGVGVLGRVDPRVTMPLSPAARGRQDRPVDTPELGRLPGSYQVTPAGPTTPGRRHIPCKPHGHRGQAT
jgi:hypothetical protein